MKSYAFVLLCGCMICVYSQLTTFQYIVRNVHVAPNFEETITLKVPSGKPMIRAMEVAADTQRTFDFGATYDGNIGYLVTTLNGVVADYAKDKTYWYFYNRTGDDTVGVSDYIPSNGDIVTFNFTSD